MITQENLLLLSFVISLLLFLIILKMCIFISVSKEVEALEKRFKAEANRNHNFSPKFHTNAYSNPLLPIITEKEKRKIEFMNWGLIPFWVKDEKTAKQLRMNTVNAKSETLTEKPSFRHLVQRNRCIVPVDGFFEHQDVNGKKFPWYIYLNGNVLFSIAGIYDSWTNTATGEIQFTFSIITTSANAMLEMIHNTKKRMPVILHPEDEDKWLNSSFSFENVNDLLKPFPDSEMKAHTVQKIAGKTDSGFNHPEIIKPFAYNELKTNISG